MFTILVIVVIVGALITWRAVSRISKLEGKVYKLNQELSELRSLFLERTSFSDREQTSEPPTVVEAELAQSCAPIHSDDPEVTSKPVDTFATKAQTQPADAPEPIKSDDVQIAFTQPREPAFEKQSSKLMANLQENWLIWVGALAMLIGGGYLVQVIGSHIEFSPFMRVTIALCLSLATVLAGEWLHQKEQKIPLRSKLAQGFTYVPAAITGTGLTGIYGTAIFAFVVYQLLTPSVSLAILAAVAFSSLFLSLRQGPSMAVLGLIGGYTAPLWIAGAEPNYYLLAGYICAISIAATMLMQTVRRNWIAPSIAVPHFMWMLVMTEAMPAEQLFPWLAIFLSFTLYLLFSVPRLGWALNPRYRHGQSKWTHSPVAVSLAIVLLVLFSAACISEPSAIQITFFFAILTLLVWLPAMRKGWSLRAFLPSIFVSSTAMLLLFVGIDSVYVINSKTWLLVMLASSIALIAARMFFQVCAGDRSQIAKVLLLVLTSLMTLTTLLYIYQFMGGYLFAWTVFTALVAIHYLVLGQRLKFLAQECSAIVHAIIATIFVVWLNDIWVTTALSIQVAVMALQAQHGLFRPANWAIKIAMGILVVRLTLLPFIPEWQPVNVAHWGWGLTSYLPSLLILAYARTILQRTDFELVNWFEGAFLHVFVMAIFTQTNYWLTGHYGYLGDVDFTSAVVFANQALVMGLVYSYRSQFAQQLQRVYQGYSYLLWATFGLLVLLLNTLESPLVVNNVSVEAMPIFNMLLLGWFLPASILIVTAFIRWNTLQIPRPIVAGLGFTLGAIWLGLSIRQFWQPVSMLLSQPTSMAELFSYSVAGLIVGSLLTWGGVMRKAHSVQRLGLIVLACVALKVFLWDVRSLDGFWRAISFLGLGGSLIALGWLFQKLNRSVVGLPK